MRQLNLKEHQPSKPLELSRGELDTLDALNAGEPKLSLAIERDPGQDGAYCLRPGSIVGAVEADNLSLLIKPKIGIPQLLSLACYAMDKFNPQENPFDFVRDESLPDALALSLNAMARRAFARGLLHGYRTEEEALYTVRGRIRFDEQIRRRFNAPLPVEVRYDEFTDDILANRLVKAAAYRLAGMRLRSAAARRGLAWVVGILDNVSLAEFPANAVPEVQFDRLNEHYRGVVGLSRLILRYSAFQSGRGAVRANGFLMDMNQVFQDFVTQALREALGVSEPVFREEWIKSLDEGGKVRLRPDLTWWDGKDCRFVGDTKYKRVIDERIPNADLYQLLAYATALNLPGGMLIYAKNEADPANYRVRHSGKTLEVVALDLETPLADILNQVKGLAEAVKALRNQSREIRSAA